MSIKITGIAIIVIASSLAGMGASQSLSQRVKILGQVISMLRGFYSQIRYRAMTVGELLDNAASDIACRDLSFPKIILKRLETADSLAEAWEYGVNSDKALKAEEKRVLEALGYSLGSSDIEGQLALLDEYTEKISSIKASAEAEYLKKGRLYRSLGVLGGAMAGIILL